MIEIERLYSRMDIVGPKSRVCVTVARLIGEPVATQVQRHNSQGGGHAAVLCIRQLNRAGDRRFGNAAAIRLDDVMADDAVYFRTLAAADILSLPVNFDARSIRYIRLSMPTKIPSYLLIGTPVLTAQQQDYSARLNVISARTARFSDTVALFQALGGGWWNRTDTDPKFAQARGAAG